MKWACQCDQRRRTGSSSPAAAIRSPNTSIPDASRAGTATKSRGIPLPMPNGLRLSGEFSPQLTAFFTSARILASSVAVNVFSAKGVCHMAPSSRFAWSLKPSVAYLDLNFSAL